MVPKCFHDAPASLSIVTQRTILTGRTGLMANLKGADQALVAVGVERTTLPQCGQYGLGVDPTGSESDTKAYATGAPKRIRQPTPHRHSELANLARAGNA